jgi:hypothetical protein
MPADYALQLLPAAAAVAGAADVLFEVLVAECGAWEAHRQMVAEVASAAGCAE